MPLKHPEYRMNGDFCGSDTAEYRFQTTIQGCFTVSFYGKNQAAAALKSGLYR